MTRVTLVCKCPVHTEVCAQAVLARASLKEESHWADGLIDEALLRAVGPADAFNLKRSSILDLAVMARRTEYAASLIGIHKLALRA